MCRFTFDVLLHVQVQVRVLPITPSVTETESIELWIIIVPIILGLLLIFILGVILYFVREYFIVFCVITVHLWLTVYTTMKKTIEQIWKKELHCW